MAKILVYDVKSLPKGWTMMQMADTVRRTGYCVHDSEQGGESPTTAEVEGVPDENGIRADIKIITLQEFEKLPESQPQGS